MADVKEKIAMLLNLASNNPSENEARAALLKARELMAKHKLRPEECQKTDKVKVIREVLGVTCTALTNPWVVSLSAVIAEHYCCCAYRTHQRGCRTQAVGMVGLEDDFEIAKRIFLYAYDCVTSACKSQIKRDPYDPPGTYREKCNAYGWGFVQGVERAFTEQDEQNQEWGLVLVVPQAVTDSMADMGKKSSYGKMKDSHSDYRAMGYQDGRTFDPTTRLSGAPERAAIGGGC